MAGSISFGTAGCAIKMPRLRCHENCSPLTCTKTVAQTLKVGLSQTARARKVAERPKWHHSTRNQNAHPKTPLSPTAPNCLRATAPQNPVFTRRRKVPANNGAERPPTHHSTPICTPDPAVPLAVLSSLFGRISFAARHRLDQVFSEKDPAKLRAGPFPETLTEIICFCIVCTCCPWRNTLPGPRCRPETRADPRLAE